MAMQTIATQLGALSILDTLKHAAKPASLTKIPWAEAEGNWSEVTGWQPVAFLAKPPTGTRSGFYYNTEKKSGDHAVGLKKTTGSLLAEERQFEVWMCSAMTEKPSGYQLAVITNKAGVGTVRFVLRRFIEGESKTLFETNEEQVFNENDSFFLARVGSKLLIYQRSGEGTPVLVGGAKDSTFTEGSVGFGGNGSNPRLINFAVGALTVTADILRYRTFNSSAGNTIITTIGSCDRREDVTLLALVRVTASPEENTDFSLIQLAQKGGTARGYSLTISQGESTAEAARLVCSWLEKEGTTTESKSGKIFSPFDGRWRLVAVRKEAGKKKADFGIFDFITREWTWEEGSEGAAAKSEANGAEGEVWFGSSNSVNNYKSGDYAAAMVAAVMSRAAVEALVAATSLIDWRPSAVGLWFFNKATVGEKVEDETGNGANQSNTPIGGSVTSDAPPIPYYRPVTGFTRTLIGTAVRWVKRWTLRLGAVRRF